MFRIYRPALLPSQKKRVSKTCTTSHLSFFLIMYYYYLLFLHIVSKFNLLFSFPLIWTDNSRTLLLSILFFLSRIIKSCFFMAIPSAAAKVTFRIFFYFQCDNLFAVTGKWSPWKHVMRKLFVFSSEPILKTKGAINHPLGLWYRILFSFIFEMLWHLRVFFTLPLYCKGIPSKHQQSPFFQSFISVLKILSCCVSWQKYLCSCLLTC